MKSSYFKNRNSLKFSICLLLLIWCLNSIRGQENAHFELWNSYESRHFVSKYRFWYRNDVSIRLSFDDNPSTLYLLRPRMIVNVGNYLEFHPAVDFRYTHFYETDNTFELRTWQGLVFHWPQIKRVLFDHFYRFEQRFHWTNGERQVGVGLRSRYRLNIRVPLNHRAIFDKTFYVDLRGEAFLPHDDDVDEAFANTVRIGVNVGYHYNPKWQYYATIYVDGGKDTIEETRSASRYILSLNVRGTF